jgi:lauroyl/myristoyl acyltransferase
VTESHAAFVPRRWTLHGLNSGTIFSMTYYGVRAIPRIVSYGIGSAGSSLVARFAPRSTAALVDNLQALFPTETDQALRERALAIYRSYTRDAIDFLRAVDDEATATAFEFSDETRERAERLHALGRGVVLVTGHYGNWEAGGLLMSKALRLPLTVVAMREASETVNRIRGEIRGRMGIDTIEVRQSLDTPLRIRAALAQNRFVALLVDRHVGKDRVEVQFLGRRAWFLRTPILMAALTGAPLVVCFVERTGPGRFFGQLGPEISIPRETPRDVWIAAAAQQIADAIGERVRARPEFWYQFYRYWDAQRDDYTGLA